MSEEILQESLRYASLGWKVVLLHPPTARVNSPGKQPIQNEWQKKATSDESELIDQFDKWPGANIGIQLGERSGIIDVEVDDEKYDPLLRQLFGDDFPICPTFKSRRGKHRIFSWTPLLPDRPAVIKILGGKVEIRTGNAGKGMQSVFPPSVHVSGDKYQWLDGLSPWEIDPPSLPAPVIKYLVREAGFEPSGGDNTARTLDDWEQVLNGIGEGGGPLGGRNNSAAALAGKMLSMISDVHDVDSVAMIYRMLSHWNDRNVPPMGKREFDSTFKSILRAERQKRFDESDAKARERRESDIESPETVDATDLLELDGKWHAVVVDAKPIKIHLFSPHWGGYLELDADQYANPKKIEVAAIEQKQVSLPITFSKQWNGTAKEPGKKLRLMENRTYVRTAPEQHQDRWLCRQIFEILSKSRPLPDGIDPPKGGMPSKLPDGRYVFKFGSMLEKLAFSPEKTTRNELSKMLEACLVKERSFGPKGDRYQLKVVDNVALARIMEIGNIDIGSQEETSVEDGGREEGNPDDEAA